MGKLTLPSFVSAQFRTLPVPEKANLAGRVVIVTGSNVGLGLEAARHFAAMGPAKLILAVRTLEKGEAAKKSIVESTKCGADVVEVWELDMSSFASVKAFAKKAEGLSRLDIVNENAGIATDQWSVTKDGYESTCAASLRFSETRGGQILIPCNVLASQPAGQRHRDRAARGPPPPHPQAYRRPPDASRRDATQGAPHPDWE